MAVAKVDKHERCRKCSDSKRNKLWREDVSKHRECADCKEFKFIRAHDLCDMCYRRSKPKNKGKCQDCGQLKILPSKNTCGNCLRLKRAKTDIRMCKNCGEMLPHGADRMCQPCYDKTRRNDVRQHGECNKCGQILFIHGYGMCETCCIKTRKEDVSGHKKCVKCKQIKFIHGHGMCTACYSKDKARWLKLDTSKHKECVECKKVKSIYAREVCTNCYAKIFVRPKAAAKRKSAKSMLTPKIEVSSGEEDEDFGQNTIDIKEKNLSEDDEMRAVSPISIEDFKMEPFIDDDQRPGPSWKY